MTTFNSQFYSAAQVPLSLGNYTLTLRNATTVTFSEVVVFFKRKNLSGVTFSGLQSFQPGEIDVLPLGAATDMISYSVGFFDGGSLVARIPEDGGEMTPAKAAQLDPARLNEYTDAWVIEAQAVLPLGNYTYEVSIRNDTPDLWDEIALFYNEKGGPTQGLSRTNVAAHTTVTFPLCKCDKLDGYTFAVFVGGLAVDFGDGALRFPPQGLMNARRALDYKLDLDVCGDLWVVD